MKNDKLELYIIQSTKSGKYFRSKGYGGLGESWVENINQAKIYTKIGPAKGIVTWWAKNFPKWGTPKILRLEVTAVEEIDQEERVKKVKKKQQEKEAQKEIRIKTMKKISLEKEIAERQAKLAQLKEEEK